MEHDIMIRKFFEKSGIPKVIHHLSLTKKDEADLNAIVTEGKNATGEGKISAEDNKENNDGKILKD